MNTDKYISLDNLDYFAGKFKTLIEDTTVPSVKLEPSGGRDFIQRNDIKSLGEGSFICYIDADNKYRVSSTDYIYGPAIFFTNYFIEDLGEGNQDHYDFLVLCTEGIKKYKTNTSDPASFTYSWTNYVTEDDMPTDLYEINTTDTINPYLLTGIHKLGLVTKPDGVSMSWTDYTSSDSESMTLPYGTFVIGSSTDYVASGVSAGGLQMLTPDGKRYTITNITAVAATVTEVSAAYMKQLAVATYNTSTFTEVINMVEDNKLVYCKVSTGGGGYRYAAIAFKDRNKVEFNYVRKTNDGNNELWVYTVNSDNTWTTVSMPISRRIVAGTNMTSSYNASTNTLTLNATGGSSLDIAEIDTAGTYTLDTFTAHTKTIITGANVNLTYDELAFYSFTGTYPTVTKDLPIGTEITCDSANTCLYIKIPNGWNYKLSYNQDTIPKAYMMPDTSQIAYDKTPSGYLINDTYSDTKNIVLTLINETQFSAITSGSIATTTTRPFFKMMDSNFDVVSIKFTFKFTTGSDAVELKADVSGAYPSSSSSGSSNYGVDYFLVKRYTIATCYIKLSDLITRSVTKVYTTNALTTEQNFWYLSNLIAGYLPQFNNEILGKNNTTVFIPTSDYNPATKKYVDDHSPDFTFTLANSSSNNKGTSSANAIDLNTLIKGHKYRYVNSGGSTTYFYYKYNLGSSATNKSLRVDSQMGYYTPVTYQEQYMYWNRVDIEMLANVSDFSNLVVNQPIAILTFDYGDGTFAPNNNTKNVRVEAVIYKSSSTAMTAACTWGHFNNYGLASVLNSINGDASSAIQQCNALDTRVTALEQGGGGGGDETIVAAGSVDGSGMTYISWVPSSAYSNYTLSVAVNTGTSEFSSLSISVSDPNHLGGTIPSSGKFIIKLKDSVNDSVLTTIDVGQLTIDAPSQMFTITDYVPAASCNIELYETSSSGNGIPVINFSDISTESTGYTYLDITSMEALNLSTGDSVFVKQDSTIDLNTGSTNNVVVYPSLWCLTKSEDPMKLTVYSLRQVTEGYGSSPKRTLSFEISGTSGMTNIIGFAYNATTL